MNHPILDTISSSLDVKRLTGEQQEQLCRELRDVILQTVSQTGGHLASNLGSVELTVALHVCFEPPVDKLVFDVGHQSYSHKLLTGRRERFSTLRQFGGLSGFPKPSESDCDAFHTGHSSTAISAAAGIAAGLRLKNLQGYTVAVVGDGAMTGGLSFEGLNNAAESGRLMIVLNDNDISISRNVGSLAHYLSAMTSNPFYFKLKDEIRQAVQNTPLVGQPLYQVVSTGKRMVKDALTVSNLFENFGFDYYGPLDGHDLHSMIDVFHRVRSLGKPALVHIKTVKGKGVPFAEANPSRYHGVSPFDASTGQLPPKNEGFCDFFGQELIKLAENRPELVAITAAMTDGVGLTDFARLYPNRFFDVGIAEQHAVTFASGLASVGCRPVVAVYSTFLQRAYDQLVHDMALGNLPVVLAVDRAGLVGEDGDTHQGIFDAAFLSTIPNVTVYSPADFAGLSRCLRLALDANSPQAVRYPRGNQPNLPEGKQLKTLTVFGDRNPDLTILTYGRITEQCLEAQKQLIARGSVVNVVSLERIHPVDFEELLPNLAKRVLFVEEGIEAGGVGQQTLLALHQKGSVKHSSLAAIPNRFVPHGKIGQLLELLELDSPGIVRRAQPLLGKKER